MRLPAGLLGVLVCLPLLVCASAQAATSPWRVIPSPNQGAGDNGLGAVSAVSLTDAWALGAGTTSILLLHWNGSSWANVASQLPDPHAPLESLYTQGALVVLASAPKRNIGITVESTNGVGWSESVIPLPPGMHYSGLATVSYVTALSQQDVWAAASKINLTTDYQMIYLDHWNGSTWQKHLIQKWGEECSAGITHLQAFAPTSVWAAGQVACPDGSVDFADGWNGTTVGGGCVPGDSSADLVNVAGFGVPPGHPADAWTVGDWRTYSPAAEGPIAADGQCQTLPLPNSYPTDHSFIAIAPASATTAWAVGTRVSGSAQDNLMEYWNGSTWTEWGGPNPTTQNTLAAAVAVPGQAGSFWAVGNTGQNPTRTLILHCCS